MEESLTLLEAFWHFCLFYFYFSHGATFIIFPMASYFIYFSHHPTLVYISVLSDKNVPILFSLHTLSGNYICINSWLIIYWLWTSCQSRPALLWSRIFCPFFGFNLEWCGTIHTIVFISRHQNISTRTCSALVLLFLPLFSFNLE